MKKIAGITICIVLIFFSIIQFLSFNYYQGYAPLFDSTPISITQDNNNQILNSQYVELLETTAADNSIDLMYVNRSIENNRTKLDYFVTDNNNISSDLIHRFDYPSIFNLATVNQFDEVEKYTLSNIQLYAVGRESNVNQFVSKLSNQVSDIHIIDTSYMVLIPFKNFDIILLTLLMYLVLFFVLLFLQISKSKQFIIKKLNGYSLRLSLIEDTISFNKFLIGPLLICIILSLLLFKFDISQYLNYFSTQIQFIIKYFILINLFFITTFIIIYYKSNIKDLKGRFFGKKFIVFINVIKIGLILLLVLSFGQLTDSLAKYKSSKSDYQQVSGTVDYSTLGVYTPNLYYDIDGGDLSPNDYSLKMQQFYVSTVDSLEGILGYFTIPENGDPATGVVNRRYLSENKVIDTNGNVIDPAVLNSDKLIYLVPEQYKEDPEVEQAIEARAELECGEDDCLQIIFVADDIDYIQIGLMNMGNKISDPVVRVLTQETEDDFDQFDIIINDIGAFISSGSYIVKTDKDNPYQVVAPYIQQAGLDNVIQEAPLLTNERLKRFIEKRNMLIISVLYVIIITIALLIGSYFIIKTDINSNSKQLSLRQINGESKNRILRTRFLKIILLYTVAIIVSILLPKLNESIFWGGSFRIDNINTFSVSEISLLLLLLVLELIEYKVIYKYDIIRNLSKNINGGSR